MTETPKVTHIRCTRGIIPVAEALAMLSRGEPLNHTTPLQMLVMGVFPDGRETSLKYRKSGFYDMGGSLSSQVDHFVMKTGSKVSVNLVRMMVRYYGSIEQAREAYRAAKATLKQGYVLMVATGSISGKIVQVGAAEVFYDRSPDAPFVLPT